MDDAKKPLMGFVESLRKTESKLVPNGMVNMSFYEYFDLKPLSANYALRRERKDKDCSDLVLADEKHLNEQLFFLCSKHSRTSEDSIFFRESRASRIDTCLMF